MDHEGTQRGSRMSGENIRLCMDIYLHHPWEPAVWASVKGSECQVMYMNLQNNFEERYIRVVHVQVDLRMRICNECFDLTRLDEYTVWSTYVPTYTLTSRMILFSLSSLVDDIPTDDAAGLTLLCNFECSARFGNRSRVMSSIG